MNNHLLEARIFYLFMMVVLNVDFPLIYIILLLPSSFFIKFHEARLFPPDSIEIRLYYQLIEVVDIIRHVFLFSSSKLFVKFDVWESSLWLIGV
mmetsp:Transcript_22576/g.21754  ORF Transcript_22576/g.21754 Transcript_22576/m.21754 type:complete len:94 (-) Transcript_22576:160-441(-)